MNIVQIKKALLCLSLSLLTSCSLLDTHQLHDKSKSVKLYDSYEQVKDCLFIKKIVGSQGTWYTYPFISNADLTIGSINDLKNKALEVGANSVHILSNRDFNTSVTLIGNAYYCES